MQYLESVFVSGNHLFIMSKSADGKLELSATEYAGGTMDVFGVKKSYQPDMVIPPNEAQNFRINGFGEFLTIEPSETNEASSMIRVATFGDWVCFYIDTDKKLIVHVQAKSEEFNYDEYQHKPIIGKTTKQLEDELLEMQNHQRDLLKSLADSIEQLSEVEKLNQ